MREVAENEIRNRLAFDNPWWETKAIEDRFRDLPRRAYFEGFLGLLAEQAPRRAVVLMGPRRVGKTVLIQQAIGQLLASGTPAKAVLYASLETPVYTGISLEKLFRSFQAIHGHEPGSRLYVFFDEIQYHPQWEVHLKSLFDSFPQVRFVASGSAAAALKLKSRESGAGRFTDFILPPLTFAEFLRFRNLEDALFDRDGAARTIHRLNEFFVDYLNYGGFPEAVFDPEVRNNMNRYVASDIIDKVLLRDLPSLYGITDTQELNRLFVTLAYNTGDEVNLEGLSQSSQVAKNTIKRYLEYLEAAFLIRRLYRVDQNARRFRRQTHFKVYLANPCIRAALFGRVASDDEAMGRLVETAVVSQLAHHRELEDFCYARWPEGEVDLVLIDPGTQRPLRAWEIKWSDRPVERPEEELRGLLAFVERNQLELKQPVFIKTKEGNLTVGPYTLFFVSVARLCYQLAKILVEESLKDGIHPLSGLLTEVERQG